MASREIKFRAWDNRGKVMLDWCCLNQSAFNRDGLYILHDVFHSPQFDLLQYTGLKDRNGREIYDGDVVDAWDRGVNMKGVITWGCAGFFIRVPLPQAIWKLSGPTEDHCEVIGNIYENPELAKF